MSSAQSEVSVFKPTTELSQVFGKPALVGQEKIEDYERFSSSVYSTIKPPDAVGWLLTKDVVDCSWDLQRERTVKAEIIKYYLKEVVGELIPLLAPPGQLASAKYRTFEADADLTGWASDPECRKKIDEALAAKGHDAASNLAQAYMRGAAEIDAIDKRIAGYERRRNSALKEAGLWNEGLLQQLNQPLAIIEGEFTETAAD